MEGLRGLWPREKKSYSFCEECRFPSASFDEYVERQKKPLYYAKEIDDADSTLPVLQRRL
jgi:hypothetical protein